jgi:hypothetical protein
MRLLHAIVVSACLLPLAAPEVVHAQQTPAPADDAYKAVEGWAEAINHCHFPCVVDGIVKFYAPDRRGPGVTIPLFLATKSPKLATTREEIREYFVKFVEEEKPTVMLCKEHEAITLSDRAVLFAGFYDFTLRGVRTPARYSFLLLKGQNSNDPWLIAHHHSSLRPGDLGCSP